MEVEVDVELRRVKALRGMTGSDTCKIEQRDKVVTGTVNQIDKDGKFIAVRLDDGQVENVLFKRMQTDILKGTELDRLKCFV